MEVINQNERRASQLRFAVAYALSLLLALTTMYYFFQLPNGEGKENTETISTKLQEKEIVISTQNNLIDKLDRITLLLDSLKLCRENLINAYIEQADNLEIEQLEETLELVEIKMDEAGESIDALSSTDPYEVKVKKLYDKMYDYVDFEISIPEPVEETNLEQTVSSDDARLKREIKALKDKNRQLNNLVLDCNRNNNSNKNSTVPSNARLRNDLYSYQEKMKKIKASISVLAKEYIQIANIVKLIDEKKWIKESKNDVEIKKTLDKKIATLKKHIGSIESEAK